MMATLRRSVASQGRGTWRRRHQLYYWTVLAGLELVEMLLFQQRVRWESVMGKCTGTTTFPNRGEFAGDLDYLLVPWPGRKKLRERGVR